MLESIYKFYNKQEKLIKAVFVLFCFSIYFIWAASQPYNSCPDEDMRFQIPKFIFENGSLPTAFEKSIINEQYAFSYASQPMLSYIISALFMKVASIFTTDSFMLLIAARLTSIISGVIYVILIIKIAEILFSRISTKWLFIVFCSMWPQMAFIFTYVNCDGIAMMAVAVVIYSWIYAFKFGFNIKNSLTMAVGLAIGTLTYLNTYIFIPISLLLYILYFVFINKDENKWKKFFKLGFFILGVYLLLTSWHFIRNIVLYDGNILARGVNTAYVEANAAEGFAPSERSQKAREMLSSLSGHISWFNNTALSFVGYFGYMSVRLDAWIYVVYGIEVITGCLICAFSIIKNKFKVVKRRYMFDYIMVITIISAVLLSYIYSYSDYQPQGRYILTALIPICCFLTKGLSKLFDKFSDKKRLALYSSVMIVNAIAFVRCLFIIINAY